MDLKQREALEPIIRDGERLVSLARENNERPFPLTAVRLMQFNALRGIRNCQIETAGSATRTKKPFPGGWISTG